MSTLSHPSDLAPAPPVVRVTLAAGWEQVPAGGALARAESHGDGEPSIVLDVLTRRPGTTPREVLAELAAADRDRPGFQEDPDFTIELSGRSWQAVNVTWDGATGPAVALHLATVLGRGPVDQVVVVSGRAGGARIEDDYAALQEMAESLVVEDVA